MLAYVILLIILLLLSAFFSSSETAYLSLQQVRLQHHVNEGVPGAARVAALLERPQSLLSAILVGNNLVNTAAAAVGTFIATELVSGGKAVLAATLVVTVLLVLFGEVTPKALALSRPELLTRAYVLPISTWARATRPIVWALDHLAGAMRRAIGAHEDSGPLALTSAELRTAIRIGAEAGALESVQSSRLLGALTLDRRRVQEIMVSRLDMVACEAKESAVAVAKRFADSRFTRLPVYRETPDDVIGYVHVADMSAAQLEGVAGRTARDLARPACFESEHASIARVLEVMRENASYMVILVDEFGGTAGLVSLEDILEEVVGELGSESLDPDARGEPESEAERTTIEGTRLLVDLSNDLGADLTEVDANTVAGLVLSYLHHFPAPGEHVDHGGFRFTVVEADSRRIKQVRVEPYAAGSEHQ
ncbi:MAG: hemolysin family protein [Dehalococcoidia bacterium]